MNVIFLSPNFPPNYYRFCAALRALGVTMLAISDQPYEHFRPELQAAITHYYRVDDLMNYDQVQRAAAFFIEHYGPIDRVDSHNEHWLATEARLRSDFNIPGFTWDDLPPIKRKSVMKQRFNEVGLATARGIVATSPEAVYAFVAEVGLPLVAKPDVGVGASHTYRIASQAELDNFLAGNYAGYFLEEYVNGVIQTFDGLADRNCEPAFYNSMQYNRGVMEVVNEGADVYYYTQRVIPADIERAGRALLHAFDIRERFFHFEFFRIADGSLVALELNLRPPGGLSLDMFNYANDFDIYREWANMLVHGRFESAYNWPYFACYIGRKEGKPYINSHEAILARYPSQIVRYQPMAPIFHEAMGSYAYILRSPQLDEVVEGAEFIQATARL